MARSSSITLPSKAQSPFKQLALSYYDMGLSIFPCLGEDGKHPLVKWKPYQDRQPTRSELDKMIARFSNANIGLITGRLSNITVVDVDDPALPLEALYDEFGETPVVVSTPRGGKHLYYRFVDEKNSTSAKRKIDVRSEGGYVIAPPSINPEMNRQYVFLEGDISFLEDLPCIKKHEAGPRRQQARLGERNTSLFNHLVKVAANSPTDEEIIASALDHNAECCHPPLSEQEVLKTVASVQSYQKRGRLFVGGEQKILMPMKKIRSFQFEEPRALSLLVDLRACHWGQKDFAISPKGYAARSGWDSGTVRQAIAVLINNKCIELVHKGGSAPGDPNLYRLLI